MENEQEAGPVRKVLTALLLLQMRDLKETEQMDLLFRAGWNNAEIAQACAISENATAVRRTRWKKSAK